MAGLTSDTHGRMHAVMPCWFVAAIGVLRLDSLDEVLVVRDIEAAIARVWVALGS